VTTGLAVAAWRGIEGARFIGLPAGSFSKSDTLTKVYPSARSLVMMSGNAPAVAGASGPPCM
jgi:hypothetical protein